MQRNDRLWLMGRGAAASLVLLMAAACLAQTSKPAKESLTADDVLKQFAQRVHAEVLPRAGKLEHEEIIQMTGKIAADVLVPHKDLLLAKSKAQLAELPKFDLDLTDGWETVAEASGIIANEFAKELERPTSKPAEPTDKNAILLLHFWNARATAQSLRAQMLVRHSSPQDYGRRAMVLAFAGPLFYAINADPQEPVIAIQTGDELFVVSLKHTDEGYYVDSKVQWLRKKDATSQPADSAKAMDQRQKLAADYFEALISADVKKANGMIAVPYSMDRTNVLTTPEQVKDMHQKIADRKGKRDIPEYTVQQTDQAPALDKAQFPKYVVYRIAATEPGRKRQKSIDIYVTDSDAPKAIGFDD